MFLLFEQLQILYTIIIQITLQPVDRCLKSAATLNITIYTLKKLYYPKNPSSYNSPNGYAFWLSNDPLDINKWTTVVNAK